MSYFTDWKDGEDFYEAECEGKCEPYIYGSDIDGNRGELRYDVEIENVVVWKNGEPLKRDASTDAIFKKAEEHLEQDIFDGRDNRSDV